MHGFIMGLPVEHLRLFEFKEKLPAYIREKLNQGQAVYDWTAYRDKFGYTDIEPIRNQEACSKYVTKYVTNHWHRTYRKLVLICIIAHRVLERLEK